MLVSQARISVTVSVTRSGRRRAAISDDRVVQVGAVDPVGLLVEPDVEADRVANDAGEVGVGQRLQVVHREDHVLRRIQRKDPMQGAGRRHISAASGSTHAFHSPVSVVLPRSSSVPPIQITSRARAGQVDAVLRRRRQVRQRAERDDRHLARVAADVRADVAAGGDGRVLGRPELAVLAAQLDVAGAGWAVRVRRGSQPALKRAGPRRC